MIPFVPPNTPPVVFDPLPLQVIGLVFIITVLVLYAAMTWVGGDEIRERIFCPVQLLMAKVTFRKARDGKRTDIVRCSVFGRRPVTCGKACLVQPART